jgi:lysine 6-dehydrogenase
MSYSYAVLGSGRQGTAAAYDMAKYGDAKNVLVADINLEAARKSAARINKLLGKDIAIAHQVDVTDAEQLTTFLRQVDSFLSAVPYWNNPGITRVAIEAKANMTDLGGKTDLVRDQMKLSPQAKEAGLRPGSGHGLLFDRLRHVAP